MMSCTEDAAGGHGGMTAHGSGAGGRTSQDGGQQDHTALGVLHRLLEGLNGSQQIAQGDDFTGRMIRESAPGAWCTCSVAIAVVPSKGPRPVLGLRS